MQGPNYWSVKKEKLVVAEVKIEYELKSDDINKLIESLSSNLSSFTTEASDKELLNTLLIQLKDNPSVAEAVCITATQLQNICGLGGNYCFSYHIKDNIYQVIVEYKVEKAGKEAVYVAVDFINALIEGKEYHLQSDIDQLKRIISRNFIGLSTGSIVNEGLRRGIPFIDLDNHIILGYGARQKRIQATLSGFTSYIGVDIAGDKDGTKKILKDFSVPIPEGILIYDEVELEHAIKTVGYPVVIKPLDGNHGRGISTNITNLEEAAVALNIAQKISKAVIVERFVKGFDYRLLVINYKFIGAIKRVAAYITGDGKSTINELIETINSEPRRQDRPGNILNKITIDDGTLQILKRNEMTLDSVLEEGRILYVKDTANVSTAAVPIDVTDTLHPYNVFQAERIARIVGLDICGIDVISPDMSVPMNTNGAAIVEVNAAPGIRMHIEPAEGTPRDVGGAILNMLFPEGSSSSIPVVAITGTNGKTTTTRLIAHIASLAKLRTGYTSTDGIYINNYLMEMGDCAGPLSSKYVLSDPTVEFAILECARGGIMRSGLGFSQCDVGIVTNVAEDHLGMDNINTIEELTRVKSIVPKTVKPNGYAILNADDPRVIAMAKDLKCNIALFSLNSQNKHFIKHINADGTAATVEENWVVLYHQGKRYQIEQVENIPATFMGKAGFMIHNVLAATICAAVNNFNLKCIVEGLRTFMPSPEKTPGRLNFFNFRNFDVIVDYAHNPAGLKALGDFIKNIDSRQKIGIITAVGDRREEDIIEVGRIAAEIFDELILKRDKDLRGKTQEDIFKLIIKGIAKVDPEKPIQIIADETEAIKHALENVVEGGTIVVLADSVSDTINVIQHYKKQEAELEEGMRKG